MSLGKPVIVSNTGGPVETVVHKETGFLVAPYAASEFAKTIAWVLTNPNAAKAMGSRCVTQFDENFTTEKFHSKFVHHFNSLF